MYYLKFVEQKVTPEYVCGLVEIYHPDVFFEGEVFVCIPVAVFDKDMFFKEYSKEDYELIMQILRDYER
jgi:hypothetical protein